MVNASMLDVATGMLLVFLVSSLIASALVEAVGGVLRRRSKHLWDTLDLLLGNTSPTGDDDKGITSIVNEIYKQPFITGLVRPTDRARFNPADPSTATLPRRGRSSKTAPATTALARTRAATDEQLKRRYYGPAHIESREFAASLLAYLRPGGKLEDAGLTTGEPTQGEVLAALDKLPKDLQAKLRFVLADAGSSFVQIRAGIEEWYDRNMDAASSWYRKQTRWFLFMAGMVLAISLNVDAVRAATTFYRDNESRAAVVQIAEKVGELTCPAATTRTTASNTTVGGSAVEPTAIDLNCVRDRVGGSVTLPVGWADAPGGVDGWTLRIVGWLIIAGSVTLGAPFWFDLLRRALNVRRKTSTG